ncbi:MAG: AAA family ATPase [Mycobacteriales bacterium]
MRVLITGMSGVGKSTVVEELRRRGYVAVDADDDGYSEPAGDGTWRWRTEAITELFEKSNAEVTFFAGCSDEQSAFAWDLKVLLVVPEPVVLERIAGRTTNTFGKTKVQRSRVLRDLQEVEPLLRRSADLVIDATRPLSDVVDEVLSLIPEH